MFCDLVGSTSIAAKLDAEEWRDLVGGYLEAASASVTEMGGHVAKKLGDGLLALFGFPVAQENDAERAARAALSIQRALADLNRKNAGRGKPELAARIGTRHGSSSGGHGRRDLRQRRQMCRQRGIGLNMPILTTVLAEAEALAGDMDAGLETIELALAATERQGERWFAAETNRIRGEILLKRDLGDTAPAEEAYRTAIAIAQQQKAQSFELRAAVSLARLWRDEGKPRQARELLAPVYGWFTEGLDTPDLKEAQALLDELHA